MLIKDAINQYMEWMGSKNRSPKTLDNHLRVLDCFTRRINLQSVFELEVHHVNSYNNYMLTKLADKTANGYASIIRCFYRFLKDERIKRFAVHRINIPFCESGKVNFLEKKEVDLILEHFSKKQGLGNYRDYVFLCALFDTGCRISELINLDRDSIEWSNKQAQVIGKRKRVRTVFFTENTIKKLQKYLSSRDDNFPALFISHSNRNNGERITRYQIEKTLKKTAQELKINKIVTPRVLRSSFATNLFTNGANILDVKEMLGHKRLSSTQRYLGVADRVLRESYDKYHR